LEQLTSLDTVNASKVGVLGFCLGGAMALNLARAGGDVSVAISLHGEHPGHFEMDPSVSYNVDYFVQMAGADDPLIPPEARDAWNGELSNYTTGTSMGYDVQIWGNTLHAFSIRYSDTFYAVSAEAFGSEVTAEGVAGIIAFDDRRSAESFDRVGDLFEMYGLIDTLPSACVELGKDECKNMDGCTYSYSGIRKSKCKKKSWCDHTKKFCSSTDDECVGLSKSKCKHAFFENVYGCSFTYSGLSRSDCKKEDWCDHTHKYCSSL